MKKTTIFGAGQLGASLLGRLKAEGVYVDFFFDNHRSGEFCGLPVQKIEQFADQKLDVYIGTIEYYDEIEAQLANYSFNILGSKTTLKTLFTSNYSVASDVRFSLNTTQFVSLIECLAIDLIDKCQLKCTYCARGVGTIPNTNSIMALNAYEKVLDGIKRDKFKSVALYNWTEPFLNPNLVEYVNLFRRILGKNCRLSLSSNLSLPKISHLEQVMFEDPDELLVSVSGFTNEIHTIYHKGSDIEVVKQQLERLSRLEEAIRRKVYVKYLDFGYNKCESETFKQFASNLGLSFIATTGYGSPQNPTDIPSLEYNENKLCEHLYAKFDIVRYHDSITLLCNAALSMDWKADVFLCCRFPNLPRLRIGNYVEDSLETILTRRQLHPFCARCDAKMS
jgi:wyosine [tRNA(Phe)-imidazoG37] synthetase (radical SAM superfamily)